MASWRVCDSAGTALLLNALPCDVPDAYSVMSASTWSIVPDRLLPGAVSHADTTVDHLRSRQSAAAREAIFWLTWDFGADGGTRTRNRPITSRVRYQLRHVGVH